MPRLLMLRSAEIITTDQDTFMELYIEDISGFINLPNVLDRWLLAILWKECLNRKGFIVYTLKAQKEKWAEQLDCSLGSINNSITKLLKKGLIEYVSRSTYTVNDSYFSNIVGEQEYSFNLKYKLKN